MSKRKKNQGLDFVVGLLKRLAKDQAANGDTRLKAIEYLIRIDKILPALDGPINLPPLVSPKDAGQPMAVDDMIEALKKQI